MNIVEAIRGRCITHELNKLGPTWPDRRKALLGPLLGKTQLGPSDVMSMGDRLSAAYLLPQFAGKRGQSANASGGTAWEALVNYYLNMCYAGTTAVALPSSFVPSSLKDALRVTYLNNTSAKLSADIDVLLVSCPAAANRPKTRYFKKDFRDLVESNFSATSIVLIQTKTNWNENAQIPMLWNMVYELAASGNLPKSSYAVGAGAFNPEQLASLGYAFVTVPTQKDLSKFKASSMPVCRVSSLTGGAYWGRKTKPHVMSSITEFFNFNRVKSLNQLPAPHEIGKAFASEYQHQTGKIDFAAFDF